GYVRKLHALRREYGLEKEPFEIMLALYEPPSVDLYKRGEDVGITAVMCAPWAVFDGGYRAAIERFAETYL
ncbi:MAG: LLM class F420-dependent oxidoreductase, partial [Mycobacterium sp.]|nr:LLM class F420-dependent oxidoreductase [Mycobacterium sp.]